MAGRKSQDPIDIWLKAFRKKLKKKAFKWKIKAVLSVVLPGAIAVLETAAAKIFLRMALRKAASTVSVPGKEDPVTSKENNEIPEAASEKQPVQLKHFKPEFITPEAAGPSKTQN